MEKQSKVEKEKLPIWNPNRFRWTQSWFLKTRREGEEALNGWWWFEQTYGKKDTLRFHALSNCFGIS